MDEDILAVVLTDKPISLLLAKPLNRSLCHALDLLLPWPSASPPAPRRGILERGAASDQPKTVTNPHGWWVSRALNMNGGPMSTKNRGAGEERLVDGWLQMRCSLEQNAIRSISKYEISTKRNNSRLYLTLKDI